MHLQLQPHFSHSFFVFLVSRFLVAFATCRFSSRDGSSQRGHAHLKCDVGCCSLDPSILLHPSPACRHRKRSAARRWPASPGEGRITWNDENKPIPTRDPLAVSQQQRWPPAPPLLVQEDWHCAAYCVNNHLTRFVFFFFTVCGSGLWSFTKSTF